MAISREQIEDILDSVSHWLCHPNVVGLDVGYKRKRGKETKQLALIVEVIVKKPNKELDESEFVVPRTLKFDVPKINQNELTIDTQTIPTDVIEVGELVDEEELYFLDPDADNSEIEETIGTRRRPCPGGLFIQTQGLIGRGTLGANFVYKGKYRLVSNNHVISKNGSVGRLIHQPTPPGARTGLVKVTNFIAIQYYSNKTQPNPVYNIQDVAWADATTNLCSSRIELIGTPKGLRAPKVGEKVRKVGAKTGVVLSAKISSLTYRYRSLSRSTNMYSWWKNGIKLDKYISAPGDSGAMYIGNDKKIVGIHRSGSKKAGHSIGAPL